MTGFSCTFLFKTFEIILGFLRHILHRSVVIEGFYFGTDLMFSKQHMCKKLITHVGRFLYSDKTDEARLKQYPCFDSEYSKWLRNLGTTMMSSTS